MKKLVSDCCGANVKERLWDDHYGYPPYTNYFICTKCDEKCQPVESEEEVSDEQE